MLNALKLLILSSIVPYLATSFVESNFDFRDWSLGSRVTMICIIVMSWVLGILCNLFFEE